MKKTYHVETDKDAYQLNGLNIQEKELFNLFEAGGFSLQGQSQFQIVQQGQVEALVAQGEEGFLRMLKEVTGTESFDSRVEKMSSVLNECNAKKQQMDKILEAIRSRLEQLGQEIGEYMVIEGIEKDRKALELALHHRKINANRVELEHIRTEKQLLLEARQLLISQLEDQKLASAGHGEAAVELKSDIRRLELRLANLLKLRKELDLQKVTTDAHNLQKSDQHTLFDYFSTSYEGQMKNIQQAVSSLEAEIA